MNAALTILLAAPGLAGSPDAPSAGPDTLHGVTLGAKLEPPGTAGGWVCGPAWETAPGMATMQTCGRATEVHGRPATQSVELWCGRASQSEVSWTIVPTGTRGPPGSALAPSADVAADGRALWGALMGDIAGWTITGGDPAVGPRARVTSSMGQDRQRDLSLDTLPDGPGRVVVQVVVRTVNRGQPVRLDVPCPADVTPRPSP